MKKILHRIRKPFFYDLASLKLKENFKNKIIKPSIRERKHVEAFFCTDENLACKMKKKTLKRFELFLGKSVIIFIRDKINHLRITFSVTIMKNAKRI